jgi:hypothetical protein
MSITADGSASFTITNGTGANRFREGAVGEIVKDNWYHIVCVFDGTAGVAPNYYDRIKIYVNSVETVYSHDSGPLVATTGTAWGTGSYVDKFWIGSSGYGTGGVFNPPTANLFEGKIDEVAYWNVALTLSEIQDIYNATEAGKTADLNEMANPPAAWYRMGD